MTNREFAGRNGVFQAACQEAGIEPTTRQASKWRRGEGLALNTHRSLLTRLPTQIKNAEQYAHPLIRKLKEIAEFVDQDERKMLIDLMTEHYEPVIILRRRLSQLEGA